jgi:hypothetical protein
VLRRIRVSGADFRDSIVHPSAISSSRVILRGSSSRGFWRSSSSRRFLSSSSWMRFSSSSFSIKCYHNHSLTLLFFELLLGLLCFRGHISFIYSNII